MERLIGCTGERETLRLVQGCSRTIIHDLRVLELGTLGHIVVTVSLSLRTVSSTDSRSYHTAAVSEEGPKVAKFLETIRNRF